ncbi:hypothetical protein VTI74DRAFT_11146 [Chaetomium olivicolor]
MPALPSFSFSFFPLLFFLFFSFFFFFVCVLLFCFGGRSPGSLVEACSRQGATRIGAAESHHCRNEEPGTNGRINVFLDKHPCFVKRKRKSGYEVAIGSCFWELGSFSWFGKDLEVCHYCHAYCAERRENDGSVDAHMFSRIVSHVASMFVYRTSENYNGLFPLNLTAQVQKLLS